MRTRPNGRGGHELNRVNRQLLILRGVPCSGKTSYARSWIREGRKRARVSRAELRDTLGPEPSNELIFAAEHTIVKQLLLATYSVVVDDENLDTRSMDRWNALANKVTGVQLEVMDLRDVPLETCLERAAGDGRDTGLIVRLHEMFVAHATTLPL